MSEFQNSIARIYDLSNNVVGTGFYVGENEVITCAHVINKALQRDLFDRSQPPDNITIKIDFPFNGETTENSARIDFWLPRREDDSGDIAGLTLDFNASTTVSRGRLITPPQTFSKDHEFQTFGFPLDVGDRLSGKITSSVANNVLFAELNGSYDSIEGFSGAPVYDVKLNGIVGMITGQGAGTNRAQIVSVTEIIKWKQIESRAIPFDVADRQDKWVNFVILSMKIFEAEELFSEFEAISSQSKKLDSRQQVISSLMEILAENHILPDNLLENYSDKRYHWKPYAHTEVIQHTIEDMVGTINGLKIMEEENLLLRPIFYSDPFFHSDEDFRQKAWSKLRDMNCVFIVDVVSLANPFIRKYFEDYLFNQSDKNLKRTAVVIISPIDSLNHPLHKLFLDSIPLLNKFDIKQVPEQLLAEFEVGIGSFRSLMRWLRVALPEIIGYEKDDSNGNKRRNNSRRIMQESVTDPQKVQNYVLGNWGDQ